MTKDTKQFVAKHFDRVLARKIKGYAFRHYPNEAANTPQEYKAKVAKLIEADLLELDDLQFADKYEYYCY